jgi:hypothetical protein
MENTSLFLIAEQNRNRDTKMNAQGGEKKDRTDLYRKRTGGMNAI